MASPWADGYFWSYGCFNASLGPMSLGQHQDFLGARNSHDPTSWPCNNVSILLHLSNISAKYGWILTQYGSKERSYRAKCIAYYRAPIRKTVRSENAEKSDLGAPLLLGPRHSVSPLKLAKKSDLVSLKACRSARFVDADRLRAARKFMFRICPMLNPG